MPHSKIWMIIKNMKFSFKKKTSKRYKKGNKRKRFKNKYQVPKRTPKAILLINSTLFLDADKNHRKLLAGLSMLLKSLWKINRKLSPFFIILLELLMLKEAENM